MILNGSESCFRKINPCSESIFQNRDFQQRRAIYSMDQERILFIYNFLSRYTDESRAVSVKEIQNYLAEACNLTSVAEDTFALTVSIGRTDDF